MDPFMRRAIELAIDNVRAGRGGPFAAVIVRNGDVLAEGTNLVTSANDPTAHAEVVAIREACRKAGHFELRGCEIYATCEPCPMCLGAIYWSRLDRIYYAATRKDAAAAGFDDSFLYDEVALTLDKRSIPMKHLMRTESLAAFEVWRQQADKIVY